MMMMMPTTSVHFQSAEKKCRKGKKIGRRNHETKGTKQVSLPLLNAIQGDFYFDDGDYGIGGVSVDDDDDDDDDSGSGCPK